MKRSYTEQPEASSESTKRRWNTPSAFTSILTRLGAEKWRTYYADFWNGKSGQHPVNFSLPYDCLLAIYDQMGLKIKTMNAIARCMGLNEEEQRAMTLHRCNPLRLLRPLTKSPEEFLCIMHDCNVLLSGSRAAGYFFPPATTETSDWDFYVHPSVQSFVRFAAYLRNLGVEWKISTAPHDSEYWGLVVLRGTLFTGQRTESIQLIVHDANDTSSLGHIFRFHSSVVQCFIAGFGAVSLHEPLTTSGLAHAWHPRYINNEETVRRANEAIAKYKDRGIRYVPPTWEGEETREYIPPRKVRRLGDAESLCIPFEPYLSDEARKSRARHDFQLLSNVEWEQFTNRVRDSTLWSFTSAVATSRLRADSSVRSDGMIDLSDLARPNSDHSTHPAQAPTQQQQRGQNIQREALPADLLRYLDDLFWGYHGESHANAYQWWWI